MDSRERVAMAMRGEVPDRVPVMPQLATGHYLLNTSVDPVDLWFTSLGFATALVELQRRYRFDGILVNHIGRPDGVLERVVDRSKNDDGQDLTFDTGERVHLPWNDNALYDPGTSGRPLRFDFSLHEASDLERVDDFGGYVWGAYASPWIPEKADKAPLSEIPDYFFRTIDLVREMTQGKVSLHGECFSPFTHYMELVGYEMALLNLLVDPVKSHAILDAVTEASVAWAVAQAKHGVDAVLMSSAFAGGPMLSPKMYEEFVSPYESRVVAAVKAEGVPVYTHTCGSIGDRLDLMVATGTEGIDTLDPPPLGNVELAEAKKMIGKKVFIKGNMNPVFLLQTEEQEALEAHAVDRLRAGGPGGGYILSTACSVAPGVAPWKLELLTPLAETVGSYQEEGGLSNDQ